MNNNHSPAPAAPSDPPENIVPLVDSICASPAAGELEQKRAAMARITTLVTNKLEHDAADIEMRALGVDMPIQQRHQLFDLARCLRTTLTWINGPPEAAQPQTN